MVHRIAASRRRRTHYNALAEAAPLDDTFGDAVPYGITGGPDSDLWFAVEQDDAMIGRITPTGTVTLFKDPGGSYPQRITTGPDGALWFGESNGTVGRMTTR